LRAQFKFVLAFCVMTFVFAGSASATVTNTFTGTVSSTGTAFKSHTFNVPQAGTLTLTLDWDTPATDLNEFLYDPTGATVATSAGPNKKPEVISFQAKTAGTWKVGVKAVSGSANYTVTVDQAPPAPTVPTYSRDLGVPKTADVSPVDMVKDSHGNWWVIDEGQACVKEYAPDLTTVIRTVFTCGSVGNGNTKISRARGMGIDRRNDDIWIADTSGTPQRVVKIDPSGNVLVSTTVSNAPGGALSSPGDVAVDDNGNAYIIDQKDRIVELNENGTFVRQFGTSGTGVGKMRNPMSIEFSSVGGNYLYVTDARNFQVDKWTLTGTNVASFGAQGTGNGRMSKDARGIAVDSAGIIYVADVGGNRVIRFAADGTPMTSLGDGLPYYRNGPLDIFYGVRGLYVDGNTLAVADMWGYRVLFWNLNGTSTGKQIGGGAVPCSADLSKAPPCNGHNEPRGIVVDAAGNTYVSDYWHQWIQKYDSSGTLVAHWGVGRGSDLGTLNLPSGLAVDNTRGYLYIANREERVVDRWDLSTGAPLARFAMPAGPADPKGWPRDVAVNEATGDVYAADEKNNQWVRFNSSGVVQSIVTTYGSGGGTTHLGTVRSIAVGSDGTVYVADGTHRMIDEYTAGGTWIRSFGTTDNVNGVEVENGIVYVLTWRVREYKTDGTPLIVWGTTGTGDSQLNSPFVGIDVDSSGRVYIGDTGNHRVKVFTP
jgi:hypothetical protein